MTASLVLVSLAMLTGLVLFLRERRSGGGALRPVTAFRPADAARHAPEDRSGWVYFVAGDDTPVKIGMTQHEPTSARLPELRTMSPVPLKLYFKQWVPDRFAAESRIHDELKDARLHGEWFDRDVALSYAAHLRGED